MRSFINLTILLLVSTSAWALNPHPRIWLTSTLLTTLAQKVNTSDSDWLALKASADAYKGNTVEAYSRSSCTGTDICYTYEGGDGPHGWYDAMITLALVYQVTGDSTYAAKALQILDAANAPWKNSSVLTPIQLDTGYPTRTMLALLAIGYDWLYPALSSTEKTDTINTINAAYAWFSTSASPVPYCMTGDPCKGNPYMNYFGGHMYGFGLAADATDGDNPQSTTIYNYIETLFTTTLAYGLQSDPVTVVTYQGGNYNLTTGGFNGGAVPESYNYGPNHNERLWKLVLAWKTSGRIDLTGTYASWMKASVKNLIYVLRPNLWQVGDEGEYPGNCASVLPQDYPLFLAYMLNGSTEGAWSENMFRNLATNLCSGSYANPRTYDAVLWKDSTRTATDYTAVLGGNYASDSDGHLFARSDWTTTGVYLSFNGSASNFTDHMAETAGNVEVQRGSDYLLVGAQQWQGTAGYGGTPSIDSFSAQYASTLYFDDGGAYEYTGGVYVGGQTGWGATNILGQRADSSVAYMLADLGSAFDIAPGARAPTNRSARFYYRAVAYMGGGTIVIWDRFRSQSSSYVKRLQWHLNPATTPKVSGSIISTSKGASSLFIDTLLPSSPTISTTRDIATSDGTSPLTYNLQVSDSLPGTDLNALTVLYPTARGLSMPSSTLITTDPNWVGAQVSDTTPLVVVFGKTVQDNGNNTYTPLRFTSTTFTTNHPGTGKYLVAGLQAGTYCVFQGGAALRGYSAVAVGADGTLFFTATSGSFSILPSGSTTSPCDLNADGVVNSTDVQIAIGQVLGFTPCGNADLDLNGVCNVVDIQRVIDAAVGQVCRTGP